MAQPNLNALMRFLGQMSDTDGVSDTDLNFVCREQNDAMVANGFYDEPHEVSTRLMLTVSELAEACEADRKERHANYEAFNDALARIANHLDTEVEHGAVSPTSAAEEFRKEYDRLFKEHIKDTYEDEIADTYIRLLDLCGHQHLNIDRAILLKRLYNKHRPYKHGKGY